MSRFPSIFYFCGLKFQKMKHLLLISSLFVFLLGNAQNIFLSRDYWKSKPNIETIKSDSKENDISALTSHKFDAVCWAILENNDFKTIEFLLKQKGNEVDKMTHDQRTYLFWAAYKGRTEIMKYLLKKGANPFLKDQFGYSVINFAATTGQLNSEVYDIMIQSGCKIQEEKMKSGANPILLLMPHFQTPEEMNYFIEKGLNIQSEDKKGNNAITYASLKGNKKLIDYLISKKINVQDNALFFAAKGARKFDNSPDFFHFLFENGANLNITDEKGENLFFKIAGNKYAPEIAHFLFKNKVSINDKNKNGITPIFKAVERNNVELVNWFLLQKAETNGTDETKNNLIHTATQKLSTESLERLLSHSKEGINAKNNDGSTPLHIACMKAKDVKIIEILIKNGADKKNRTEFDETPFDLAKSNEILSEKKVNVDFLK